MNNEWKKIAFNRQNICAETDRSILIQMPNKSAHNGYKFWISKKLLRKGRHSYEYLLSIKSDMEFELKKYGNGKHNRFQVIAETKITAEQLAEAFDGYVDVEPQKAPKVDFEEETVYKHTPEPLKPVEMEIDPELAR